ncbi:MAG: hypothetical protein LBI42_01395 [Chitinispirillales bacterium]|jgi:hypothetical protein|nr:hypothetical protein [Chitinispirillales bacterium]
MANSSLSVKKEEKRTTSAPQDTSGFKHWSLLCIGILFIVTTVVFSSFVFSDKMLVASDQMQSVDMKQHLANSFVEHKQFPAWLSTRLAGMPSVDALFGDALYPPTTVMRPFVPAYRIFGIQMVLHIFIAGAFFFFMMRKSFGTGRLTAFTGAMFYMLSPQFVSHVQPGHDGKMFVIAWLPFVIWRLRSLLSLPTLRNAALMGLGIAMMILTSHIQMTYFVLWGVFLYWVTDTVLTIVNKEKINAILTKGAFFWTAVIFGLGISFVQFFPSFMYVREAFSVRGIDRGFEHAASWSMHWAEFFSLWVHEFGNALQYYWGQNYFKLNTEYAGAIPLLLSVLAVVSKPKSVWRIFWAAISILAAGYALGANTPLFNVLYHIIPGVKSFRAPSMIMFWFTFGTILLSLYFVKDLLGGRFNLDGEKKRKWTLGLWGAVGAVTLIAILFSIESFVSGFSRSMIGGGDAHRVFKINFAEKFVPALWLWWFFCALSLGMLLAVVNGKLKPAVLVFTLLGLSVVDMIKVNSQFIEVDNPRKYFYTNDATLNELKSEFQKAPFRVFSVPRTFPTQNQEGVYGLEGVGGFHDNELNSYRAFRGDQGDSHYLENITEVSADGRQMSLSMAKMIGNTPFLDLADVGYVLLRAGSGGITKVKNHTSLGRLSYASDYVVMPEEQVTGALRSGSYNYRTTVALLEEPQLPFSSVKETDSDGHSAKQLKVDWKKYSPNVRIASVTMPADGFLRISEVYYPGWRISVNGSPVKYYRSDMTWIAVALKAGSYEVLMEPKSLYMDNALKVSLAFTAIAAVVLILPFVRKNRNRIMKAKI